MTTALKDLEGTSWAGRGELWADPLGDQAEVSDVAIEVKAEGLEYSWSYRGKPQRGSVTLTPEGAHFQDSWHQPEVPMRCHSAPRSRALVDVMGSYGPDNNWGWRVIVSLRTPTGELVLQMTNIAPWGEEARAVRMVGAKA